MVSGQACAWISDAGTPVFSDPGAKLVDAVLSAGYAVMPIPGACAAIAALSASGFAGIPFHFYGFLPAHTANKRKVLAPILQSINGTLCFYESPHRLLETLALFQEIWGEDKIIVLAKELSKLYEMILKKPIAEVLQWLQEDDKRQQGEFVILLENTVAPSDDTRVTLSVDEMLIALMAQMKLKEAVTLLANLSGLPKNTLYDKALGLKSSLSLKSVE